MGMIARFDPVCQRVISLTFWGLMRIIADLARYLVPEKSGV